MKRKKLLGEKKNFIH